MLEPNYHPSQPTIEGRCHTCGLTKADRMLVHNDYLICDSCLLWIDTTLDAEAQRRQYLAIVTHYATLLHLQAARVTAGDDPAIIDNNLTCMAYWTLTDVSELWPTR